ncbi:regulator [Methylomonas sp. SURF-1]|uniref:Regulator n=1 Tax=Methylomonas aurea TaxID=2952224 RepID=A0ABT1UN44_9GAMM|nr:regulator [Methylomonas sp. SURF-1]MCQ8183655.1 regulator [Methylomonas sp. SURF-1]
MTAYRFDDRRIRWQTLTGFEHLTYSILDLDQTRGSVDVLFKFAANRQIVLHRHKVLNKTFVVQGEHRLYHPDGSLKEIRATGSYTVSPAKEEPHREGGGEIDVIVLFQIVGDGGVFYEILDDAGQIVASLGMTEFAELYRAQCAAAAAAA